MNQDREFHEKFVKDFDLKKQIEYLTSPEWIKNMPAWEDDEKIVEIATRYPHSIAVVRYIYDVVKDYSITEKILDHSAQRALSPYVILNLLIEDARMINEQAEREKRESDLKRLSVALKELNEVNAASKFITTAKGAGPRFHPKKKKRK
jgi:hypothetical protein